MGDHYEREERENIHIERGEEHALEDIALELHKLREAAEKIAGLLVPSKTAKKLVVTILDSKGNPMATPVLLLVGQSFTAAGQEFDSTGAAVPSAGALAFSSDNTAIATVDPASGAGTKIAAGSCNIVATDSVNGLSGSQAIGDATTGGGGVPTSLVVTVTPGPAPAGPVAAFRR
jgi:hypothetical protein